MPGDRPLLELRDLHVQFGARRSLLRSRGGVVRAVDGVSLTLERGKVLGLVGESGCGKSTTARAIVRVCPITSGQVLFDGIDITRIRGPRLRRLRSRIQIVQQNPYASLNPRLSVGRLVAEPLRIHRPDLDRAQRRRRVAELLGLVGLPSDVADRYPNEFSGGQRQRVAIARALAVEPDLLVCDEPTAALDVSVQAQVLNLLADLRERLRLTYVVISHDLGVIRYIADDVAVMYVGKVVEHGPARAVLDEPLHPYTKILQESVPVPDVAYEQSRGQIRLRGDLPSPTSPPDGCRFHTRCPFVEDDCRDKVPHLEPADHRVVACHHWKELRESQVVIRTADPTTGAPASERGTEASPPVTDVQ